jgi:hypothetical protein
MRFFRTLLVFKLGAYAGLAGAAALLKRALPSRGDETSDDVALVAIFDGIRLTSRAQAFRGGSLLSWFGGIDLDLREATLAPDARLTTTALFGGISLRVPPGWRVESDVRALAGGVDLRGDGAENGQPDAPTLRLDGLAAFGGVSVVARAAPSANEP